MKPSLAFSILLLSSSLLACNQTSVQVKSTQALGVVEIGFDTQTKKSMVKFRQNKALVSESSVAFTPSAFAVTGGGSSKYLTAKFIVTNSSGSAIQDLTLVAYHQASNQADTAIKNLANFAGLSSPQLDAYARAAKPINGVNASTPIAVNNAVADLQGFTEAETSSLQTDASSVLASGEYLFPYGFVARASNTSRLIPNGSNTGNLTVGVKVPDSNEPGASATRFLMTFVVFSQPVASRVTESLEEQGTTNANTRKTDFAASDVFAFGGSSLLSNPGIKRGCVVRTAGDSSSPLDYLVNSFNLTTFSPSVNAPSIAQNSSITITADQNVNAPSSSDWLVRGSISGLKSGVISGGGSSSLTFNPDSDFRAGELVSVTLKNNAITSSSGGACVPGGRSWQFIAGVGTGVGSGNGTFGTNTEYITGSRPYSVVVGDVNADGKLDIISANFRTLSVLLGNGDSTFQTNIDYFVSSFMQSVTLDDVNMDNKLDIITLNTRSRYVSVLLGNGDGTFQAKTDYNTGSTPYSVALGDVNADGKLDIVTANFDGNSSSVFLSNGDGTFQARTDCITGSSPRSVALGDMNADGKLDIVTANSGGDSSSVLFGNGNGTFQAKIDYSTGSNPYFVVVGDVNADGKLDIITANFGGDSSSVLLGKGDGTFQNKTDYTAGFNPISVALSDMNADGKLDIITANSGGDFSSVLLGNGDGTFQAKTDYTTGSGLISLAVGDVNAW